MRKLLIILVSIILLASTQIAYAYWANEINNATKSQTLSITIGEWNLNPVDDEWNLDIWEDNDELNQTIPEGQLFSYNNILYVVRDGANYNPEWHGLPGQGSNQWAYVALALEWLPNMNYRTNAVVIRNSRYFIANHLYNNNWFVGDPLNSSNTKWSEWREIEPLPESYFGYLDDYPTVKDYRANPNDVTYK